MGEQVETVRISVRNLVEFILREGNIDNRGTGSMDPEIMQLGGRLHRKIQKRMGPEYQAEVSLKIRIPCDRFVIQIEGRADGILTERTKTGVKITVDEIKGVLRDVNLIEKPFNVHLAQAKCYACIYALQNGLEKAGVRMTYCNLDTEEIRRFESEYTREELEEWFSGLVKQYEKWAGFSIRWKQDRDASISRTEFPFAYRKGQKDVAAAVYRTILRKKKIFIQAPTGVGKTISTVFPAVKALGCGLGDKIFYLTAKTITRSVAARAFHVLQNQGACLKVVTLTAKEKICFCEETECNPQACPYASGHYDRVNDALFSLITEYSEIDRNCIEEQARKYRVCPFELSLDASIWADAVICDYNYVFDPNAHLKRFFSESGTGEYLFLIDEAHNLVERGREMYSASLYKEEILEAKNMMRTEAPVLSKRAGEVNRQFLELKRECEDSRILESVSHLALKLMNLLAEMERYLEEAQESEKRKFILELYFRIRSFLNIHDILDENYVIYSEMEADGTFKVVLYCINPSRNLQNYLEYGRGVVFFSATLLPIHYYRKLLSVDPEDYAIYAESPFPKQNRLLLIGRDVSTRYSMRGEDMYERIASYIGKTVKCRPGNYLVFFPSYRLMEDVYRIFDSVQNETETIMQTPNMREDEREAFLERFEDNTEKSLIGFCVMGGIFSEGIDLANDRLIGAVIVGTGLPQVCTEREMVRQYFEREGLSGFDYAYLYPGMNKVLQSAGRVIRTENDRGIVLLLDDRFTQRQYREMFPREWDCFKICAADTVSGHLEEFWK